MIKNRLKELKLDKDSTKFIVSFVVAMFASLYLYNYSILHKMEVEIKTYDGKKGFKGTAYESLELKFDDVSCHGFFAATSCTLENPKINVLKSEDKKKSFVLFKADSLDLKDIHLGQNQDVSLNAKANNIQFGDEYFKRVTIDLKKNKKTSDLLSTILKETIPVNLNLNFKLKYLGFNKFKKREYKGKLFLGLESKFLDLSVDSDLLISEGRGKIITFQQEVPLNDGSGETVTTELSTRKEEFARLNTFNVNIFQKEDISSYLYNVYLLKLTDSEPFYKKIVNTKYLGLSDETIVSKKDFNTVIESRFIQASNEGRNKFESEYYKMLAELWENKKNKVVITYKNKSGITMQEMQMIESFQHILTPNILELKYFDTKIESSLSKF